MRNILWLFMLLTACSTAPKTIDVNEACGATPVMLSDFSRFGFKPPPPGKIVVMRVFATWCPFCKTDLGRIGALFQSGKWTPETVELYFLAYKNHGENKATFDMFVKDQFASFGIPAKAAQLVYIDEPYADLVKMKSASDQPLFTGWAGVPFALVFGKDGRMAYRGHFTMSDVTEDKHYKFISGLQKETCAVK
jgi:thiol-disulfide isomerase/thioredoxin